MRFCLDQQKSARMAKNARKEGCHFSIDDGTDQHVQAPDIELMTKFTPQTTFRPKNELAIGYF